MQDLSLIAEALRFLAETTGDVDKKKRCLELARNFESQVISAILDET